MPLVVVDTCVLSYLYNRHSLAEAYRPHLMGNTTMISFMTLAELHYGALKRSWGEANQRRLLDYVRREYSVYPFNRDLCLRWAAIRDQTERAGRQVSATDSWIAATAILYGIPLVTNNRKHFEVLEPSLTLITEA
jgi:tRNA(fMet)-specific endonuclease VapC